MFKAKQFYLKCLEDGPKRHDRVANQLKNRFDVAAVSIRDSLVESGHIRQSGSVLRKDGKRVYVYELTGKELKESKNVYNPNWEDGTPKSRGNAFDWHNFSKGVYSQRELAAAEQGRKWGVNTASKQILPRTTI